MPFRRGRGEEPDKVLATYERESLEGLLKSLGQKEPLFRGLAKLIFADGPEAREAAIRLRPELASERGSAALEVVVSFATMTGLVTSLPALQGLQTWLRNVREEPTPAPPGSGYEAPRGPYELVGVFIDASVNADQTYLRTGDLTEVREGINVWEQMTRSGLLADAPPESLVEAHLMIAMLYARRYEVEERGEDLDRAFGYLRQAQQHVIPGSDNDVVLRMSSASWLMLRFQTGKDRADLEQAIAGYGEVIGVSQTGSAERALARANLGRALLARYQLTGASDNLRQAREMLSNAATELPPGHPSLPSIQQALASASLLSAAE